MAAAYFGKSHGTGCRRSPIRILGCVCTLGGALMLFRVPNTRGYGEYPPLTRKGGGDILALGQGLRPTCDSDDGTGRRPGHEAGTKTKTFPDTFQNLPQLTSNRSISNALKSNGSPHDVF